MTASPRDRRKGQIKDNLDNRSRPTQDREAEPRAASIDTVTGPLQTTGGCVRAPQYLPLLAADHVSTATRIHQGGTMAAKQLTMDELTAGLDQIRQSPADDGEVRMIMRRPAVNERELLEEGQLDLAQGLSLIHI